MKSFFIHFCISLLMVASAAAYSDTITPAEELAGAARFITSTRSNLTTAIRESCREGAVEAVTRLEAEFEAASNAIAKADYPARLGSAGAAAQRILAESANTITDPITREWAATNTSASIFRRYQDEKNAAEILQGDVDTQLPVLRELSLYAQTVRPVIGDAELVARLKTRLETLRLDWEKPVVVTMSAPLLERSTNTALVRAVASNSTNIAENDLPAAPLPGITEAPSVSYLRTPATASTYSSYTASTPASAATASCSLYPITHSAPPTYVTPPATVYTCPAGGYVSYPAPVYYYYYYNPAPYGRPTRRIAASRLYFRR